MTDYWTGVAWGVAYLVGTIIAQVWACKRDSKGGGRWTP